MKIILNGEARKVADSLSILQLLTELNLSPQHVVVEVNRDSKLSTIIRASSAGRRQQKKAVS